MGVAFMGFCMGGGRYTDAGGVKYRGGSGRTLMQARDAVRVPADWEDAGIISPSGSTETDGADATAELEQDMDIPSPGGGNNGGGRAGF